MNASNDLAAAVAFATRVRDEYQYHEIGNALSKLESLRGTSASAYELWHELTCMRHRFEVRCAERAT
jgi:hypothetical protein